MDGILLINKPAAMTSFDVCAKLRKGLKEKSVGHTGTLDPNATGLLIVLLGKYCKFNPYFVHDKKEYIATFSFGYETTTLDSDGEVVATQEISEVSELQLKEILTSFVGESEQIPPSVSALKVDGKRSYDLARAGIMVEHKPRKIVIDDIELLEINNNCYTIRCVVSQGTYIRSLIKDIAKKTNNLGTMTKLIRSKIAHIDVSMAQSIDEAIENPICHDPFFLLKNTIEMVEVSDEMAVKNGKRLHLNSEQEEVMVTYNHQILACYSKESDGIYKCKRGLW